jgi:3-hydroxyacyl-CoA dehydrogenase/enoyl-CoA hydratase/3-hydroxybutyryl-CoA epimerase
MNSPISTVLEADGVLMARIDMADRTMNVFSVELMDALDALMDRVDADPAVHSVVITSGKPSFLAGADLVMVRGYCDAARTATHDQMFEMCGRLGRQFVRLETSAKPWVAAVNGLALGGGLELAMACRARLVADDPRIQLGLPEVRWGLLPGAGGTQRMPRLLDFELAMDLLLSGRSLTPADAVRAGLFARAVPAARLLEEAHATARMMNGTPYDAAAKFPHLAQRDVPMHSDLQARTIAARHNVEAERFELYPAFSAIVSSVLKGARLPLAEATAVEMRQFLRLMFSPVAGRMVRTLFLERLRAERELAPRADLRIERLVVGPFGAHNAPWSVALARLKVPQTTDATLPPNTLEVVETTGRRSRVALWTLDAPAANADRAQPACVLAPDGPYGRVLEIVGGDAVAAQAATALAARLRALPWHTPGPTSVLQRLNGLPLAEQAAAAHAIAREHGAGDPAFLDVAACLAGIAPAWSGGPLTWAETT